MDNKSSNKKVLNKIQLKLKTEDYFLPYNTYAPDVLADFFSKGEYDALIKDANKVISLSWIDKKKFDKIKIPLWVYGIAFLAAACFLIYFLALYFAPRTANGDTLYYVGLAFCVIGIVLSAGLSVFNFAKKVTTGKDLEVFIYEGLEKWCRETNKKINENIAFSYDKKEKVLECMVYTLNQSPLVFHNGKEAEEPLVHQLHQDSDLKKSQSSDKSSQGHHRSKTHKINSKDSFSDKKND